MQEKEPLPMTANDITEFTRMMWEKRSRPPLMEWKVNLIPSLFQLKLKPRLIAYCLGASESTIRYRLKKFISCPRSEADDRNP